MPEPIYPVFVGLVLATIIGGYRQGWIRKIIQLYKKIDSRGILIDSIIIITSPFFAVFIYNFINKNNGLYDISGLTISINRNVPNPLPSLPFQALATGFGIIFGNSVINWIKKEDEIKEIKKVIALSIKEHLMHLKNILSSGNFICEGMETIRYKVWKP